jgi:hypothetical protein
MTTARANVLRVLTAVVFVAVAILAVRAFTPAEPTTIPKLRAGETAVDQAISIAGTRPLIVRGHVFDGPGGLGLRLCNGRKNTATPGCLGPFLDLDGVNEGSFRLESGTTPEHLRVRWSPGDVALRGTIVGTRMRVTEILK